MRCPPSTAVQTSGFAGIRVHSRDRAFWHGYADRGGQVVDTCPCASGPCDLVGSNRHMRRRHVLGSADDSLWVSQLLRRLLRRAGEVAAGSERLSGTAMGRAGHLSLCLPQSPRLGRDGLDTSHRACARFGGHPQRGRGCLVGRRSTQSRVRAPSDRTAECALMPHSARVSARGSAADWESADVLERTFGVGRGPCTRLEVHSVASSAADMVQAGRAALGFPVVR